jgi:DNA-binding response OmpR family regulator
MAKKILVIDDEKLTLDAIETILTDMGYQVKCFSDSVAGEKEALEQDFDLILVDIQMPEKDGAAITKTIVQAKRKAKILIITAFPADPLAKRALDLGAKALLKKPFEISKILDFLQE